MRVFPFQDLPDGETFDFVVVGSGFGGSVAALRLAQKGYSVAVLEAGRHFEDADFPESNWRLRRYLWLPRLFLYGIQRLTFLRGLLVLSGAGVGGGSLVYAGTLLEPGARFYESPECARLDPNLKERLAPHFAAAKRMLGVAENPRLTEADEALRSVAKDLGREATFHRTKVGVHFGEPGKTVPDPYFGGEGPERAGCVFCGGCMVGCRHNAKNTLTKNYLHLAARSGARIFEGCQLSRLRDEGGDFRLTVSRPGWSVGRKTVRAKRLVFAAGVLGTMRLLLDHQDALPRLSPRVGHFVRTNSEVILGAMTPGAPRAAAPGVALSSGMWPADDTHVEVVRYPDGSDAMALLGLRQTPPGSSARKLAALVSLWLTRPLESLRFALPFGWAARSAILLVMQTRDARLRLARGALGLKAQPEAGCAPPPTALPLADDVLARFARKTKAVPFAALGGGLLGVSTTAHILGGAVMAKTKEEGVCDPAGRLFGYEDRLWVCDGSLIPANLGVNPSLTIAALAEQAMSLLPAKAA